LEAPAPGAVRVGFISNFTNPASELKVIEPALNHVSETGLRILFSKLQVLFEGKPVKIVAKNLLGGRVHFSFYLLPFDTAFLENVSRWGKKRFFIAKIQDAVNKLAAEGVTHIGLGAYASILSGNGLCLVAKSGVRIITGNTLTLSSCLYHLNQCLSAIKDTKEKVTIAVVGASGNIGSGLVRCLADEKYTAHHFILIGSNRKRLQKLQQEQNLSATGRTVLCTEDLFSLQNANIIICCTNTNDPIIFAHHLSPEKAVYIIDIAVPPALSAEAGNLHNVTMCKKASAVALPQNPELLISSHTEKGTIFCCAGEVLLDALYKTDLALKGHIDSEAVKTLYQLAQKEGFFEEKHEGNL
jgi:predicted amino acid dehydrogenase